MKANVMKADLGSVWGWRWRYVCACGSSGHSATQPQTFEMARRHVWWEHR